MDKSTDLGKAFDTLKDKMKEEDRDSYAREMSIEFLKYAIDKSQFMTKDEKGYFVRVTGEEVTPEELFDRFI